MRFVAPIVVCTLVIVASAGCNAGKLRTLDPEGNSIRSADVVPLLENLDVRVGEDFQSGAIDIRVPKESISVVVTAEGQRANLYAVGEWLDDEGKALIYEGWLGRPGNDGICRDCINPALSNQGVLTGYLPNNKKALDFQAGIHTLKLYGTEPSKLRGSAYAKVVPRLPLSGQLDLNLYFSGIESITAESAPTDALFQQALETMRSIYRTTGIELGEIRYLPLPAGFEVISDLGGGENDFMDVLQAGDPTITSGVNIFLVSAIMEVGHDQQALVLGISGGIPGPFVPKRTVRSGVTVALSAAREDCEIDLENEEYICDPQSPLDAVELGETLAHEVGHYLGLFHTVEFSGAADPIEDTPTFASMGFMMYPSAAGGQKISEQQA
ncbi:MAG: hypothetical protein KC416_05790, partial [Myxococcales bacterium]|nr:hypothetical protein [Myxococcales bacterium]